SERVFGTGRGHRTLINQGLWLAMAVAVGVLAAQAGTAGAGSLRTGFLDPSAAGAGSIPGFPINDTVTAQRVAGAGAGIERLYAFWQKIAPTEPNNPQNP